MQPYKIVLADSQSLFRQGVKKILEEIDGLKVIGEAEDGRGLVSLLRRSQPDMVILDTNLPEKLGVDVIADAKKIRPAVKILVLTSHREHLIPAMAAGTDGYILKQDAASRLLECIRTVREGRKYVSELLSETIPDLLASVPHDPSREILSLRETQVLKLIAEGNLNREIADLLCISVRTVEHHRASIRRKLRTSRHADLVKYALQKGYLETILIALIGEAITLGYCLVGLLS